MADTERSAERERLRYLSERVQTEWFRARATRFGGTAWDDGPLFWTDGLDGQNLMFPRAIPLEALDRGIERARANGHELVGAWLENETDASTLAARGFERGWAPWWMSADPDVWPPFRRTGLGAGLLHAVAAAAREADATTAALSTSPQGALVYRAQGFSRIGQGSTWWLHLDEGAQR